MPPARLLLHETLITNPPACLLSFFLPLALCLFLSAFGSSPSPIPTPQHHLQMYSAVLQLEIVII